MLNAECCCCCCCCRRCCCSIIESTENNRDNGVILLLLVFFFSFVPILYDRKCEVVSRTAPSPVMFSKQQFLAFVSLCWNEKENTITSRFSFLFLFQENMNLLIPWVHFNIYSNRTAFCFVYIFPFPFSFVLTIGSVCRGSWGAPARRLSIHSQRHMDVMLASIVPISLGLCAFSPFEPFTCKYYTQPHKHTNTQIHTATATGRGSGRHSATFEPIIIQIPLYMPARTSYLSIIKIDDVWI